MAEKSGVMLATLRSGTDAELELLLPPEGVPPDELPPHAARATRPPAASAANAAFLFWNIFSSLGLLPTRPCRRSRVAGHVKAVPPTAAPGSLRAERSRCRRAPRRVRRVLT